MKRNSPNVAAIRRLQLRLSLTWATAWAIGIGTLALIAIELDRSSRADELDGQLELTATAAYGLTWFDAKQSFHGEVLDLETEIVAGPLDIWILSPTRQGAPLQVHFSPRQPRFDLVDLDDLASLVVTTSKSIYRDGVDKSGHSYRLHARPTFADFDDLKPRAAVIVIADSGPARRGQAEFQSKILGLAFGLGAAGLLVGVALARWSLRPATLALLQRERFLSAAAHELRTPIASLRAVCDSALAGDEPAEVALSRASSLTGTAAEVIDDLLLYAKLETEAETILREKLRLDLLVEACLPAESSIPLDAEECVVEADARLVRVAVRNLIRNAEQHGTGKVGDVLITVAHASVTVTDHGAGFSAAILALSRTAFASAPSRSGSGIGLATVSMIAELHGGVLVLENLPSGGASARFQLPKPRE